jgi:uncharacterized protein (DUF2062 family)
MSETSPAAAAPGRRLFHRLRTEGNTPGRQAAAFALGTFIGCSPFFGFHLPLSFVAGWLFGLNRLKVYLASNISNPFMAPLLLFSEVQAGRWLRVGSLYPLSLDVFRAFNVWSFGADLVLGSLVVGAALASVAAGCTYGLARRPGASRAEADLFAAAADRYLASGIFAWEFANGKLRKDPVYREVLRLGLLPAEGTLVDLGCGRGLMLALLAAARERWTKGAWPAGWPPAPARLVLRGVELRGRIATSARQALGDAGAVDEGNLGGYELPPSRAVLLFDVLQMIPYDIQDRVLERVAHALEPGGVLILREADAAGGWRFRIVHAFNWMKGVFEGSFRRRFYFRTTEEWTRRLESLGLVVRCFSLREDSPLPNMLIEARRGEHTGRMPEVVRRISGSDDL